MTYGKQVDKEHYMRATYRSSERWISYWHQLALIDRTKAHSVLEIGVGSGVVARELTSRGLTVATADIAEDLRPDIVCSVTDIVAGDASYDTVLAAEILEHIRFEDVPKALRELHRVARKYAVVSVPHPGWTLLGALIKIPKFKFSLLWKIPFFFEATTATPEHYWELGRPGFPLSRFEDEVRKAGFSIEMSRVYADDPVHRFFLLKKI